MLANRAHLLRFGSRSSQAGAPRVAVWVAVISAGRREQAGSHLPPRAVVRDSRRRFPCFRKERFLLDQDKDVRFFRRLPGLRDASSRPPAQEAPIDITRYFSIIRQCKHRLQFGLAAAYATRPGAARDAHLPGVA